MIVGLLTPVGLSILLIRGSVDATPCVGVICATGRSEKPTNAVLAGSRLLSRVE